MHYLDHKNFLHFSRFFAHLSIFHTKRLKKYFANIMSLALFGKLIHTLPRSHYFSAFIKIFSETFPRSHVGYVISLGLCEHGNSVLQFRSAQSFSVPRGMECRLHYKLDYKDYKKKMWNPWNPENSVRKIPCGIARGECKVLYPYMLSHLPLIRPSFDLIDTGFVAHLVAHSPFCFFTCSFPSLVCDPGHCYIVV